LYGRVSTSKQTTTTQEAQAKDYLRLRQIPLGAEFYDEDASGSIPIWDRPEGRKLRARLQAGGVKHLVVTKLDRLGRSASDLLNTVEFLDSLGVTLHVVDLGGESLSTHGPSGRLMFIILAGMAQFERTLIQGRIQDCLNVKRERGELTGTVPYGWNAVETGQVTVKGVKVRRLEPNPDEQHWILTMMKLRQSGLSYGRIAKYLNEHQVPTKLGKGSIVKYRGKPQFCTGKWQTGNVGRILSPKNKTVQTWLALSKVEGLKSLPAAQAA
jgi:DNA invertase Pin-like site-specific DNA recombinase